jgi:hypothetical protein
MKCKECSKELWSISVYHLSIYLYGLMNTMKILSGQPATSLKFQT